MCPAPLTGAASMGLMETYRMIRIAKEVHSPVASELAGDSGEGEVNDAIEQVIAERGQGLAVRRYAAIRVPQGSNSSGKFEIDTLLVSPFGIVGIEVKNWGGRLDIGDDGVWQQVSSRGVLKQHTDPLVLIREKMQAVARYLEARDVPLPEELFSSLVVLVNPRLRIGSGIAQLGDVVHFGDLKKTLSPMVNPNGVGMLAKLGMFLGLLPKTAPRITNGANVIDALDELPTWDRVLLHGGRVLKGDVARPGVPLANGDHLTRKQARSMRMAIPRSWVSGWVALPTVTWTDYENKKHKETLMGRSSIRIKLAGQSSEEDISVLSVMSIDFGYRDHSYFKTGRLSPHR
jgi:hypothetical protein